MQKLSGLVYFGSILQILILVYLKKNHSTGTYTFSYQKDLSYTTKEE